jgi:hypothetical protein
MQHKKPGFNNTHHEMVFILIQFVSFSVPQVITGNKNTYLEAKNELDPPIWASKIRFLPYSYHRRTVCMRVEIYGCYWNGKWMMKINMRPWNTTPKQIFFHRGKFHYTF